MFKKRLYRTNKFNSDLITFEVKYFESNLLICSEINLKKIAEESLRRIHTQVSQYCNINPDFKKSLLPVKIPANAPRIIKTMQKASKHAGVGPMATVAGAVAEAVANDLLSYSNEVIVENGGDIFISSSRARKIGIFAGLGNVYNKLVIKISPEDSPCGICTSSGKFGHSLSLGNTCATIVIANSSALADGYATAYGNMVKNDSDTPKAIKAAKKEKGIKGIIVITNSNMAAYGKIDFELLDK